MVDMESVKHSLEAGATGPVTTSFKENGFEHIRLNLCFHDTTSISHSFTATSEEQINSKHAFNDSWSTTQAQQHHHHRPQTTLHFFSQPQS
jgi:hypothetical protein